MNRKHMNKAFAKSFQGGGFGQRDNVESTGSIPYAMLKAARRSGQLNLSGRSLSVIPDTVWKINLDVPDEAKNVSLADTDERWWDQVDLRKLILASNQLTEIPPEIKLLPALNVLDAHDNNVVKLAEEIEELKELGKLHLSHNKLSIFPDSICTLASLKSLLVTGNAIVALPDNFGYLCNLEELDLAQNQLKALPESFGNLRGLKKLNLSKNQISDLPVGFDCLSSLLDLDISSNKLTTLPAGFGKLTSLEIVECRYNLITSITKFTNIANIKQLFLGYNRIRKLEDDIFEEFPHLVSLDLRDNSLSALPGSLLSLQLLERVDLTNNNLSALPYALGTMKLLKAVTVDGNPMRGIRRDIISRGTQAILEYLRSRMPIPELQQSEQSKQSEKSDALSKNNNKESIAELNAALPNGQSKVRDIDHDEKKHAKEPSKAIVDQYLIATTKVLAYHDGSSEVPDNVWLLGAKIYNVDFSKNTLKKLPDQILNYKDTLAELNLSQNKIPVLPNSIGHLTKLAFLDLSNNQLTDLPQEISTLPHLLQIIISFNQFSQMPKALFEMKTLQTLLIGNNQLNEIDVDGLLKVKTLHTLDLSNNSIARIPPQLGNVSWLKSLNLDGNSFRSPRPQIMMKGTQFILEYLRDRIPT